MYKQVINQLGSIFVVFPTFEALANRVCYSVNTNVERFLMSKKTSTTLPHHMRQQARAGVGHSPSLRKAKKLTERQPHNSAAWKQLGAELSEAGARQEALEALDRALALAPDDAEVLAVKGKITHQLGDPEKGLSLLQAAVDKQPKYAKAHHYIGYIYYTQARYDDALPYAEEACRLEPDNVDMLNTLGNILMQRFEYARAQETLERAARLAPNNYLSWNNLGNIYNAVGDLDKGLKAYQQAHRTNPQAPGPYSNIITTHHYHPHKTAEEITALCKQWEKKFAATAAINAHQNPLDPQKRLKVGLISDGFRGHPVGRMITSALENVAKEQLAFYFYSTNNAFDGITQRLEKLSEKWMSVQHLSDEQVVAQIVSDEIDILIDLAGHNAGNRAFAVSQRPAPVQVKWVGGLINTTGLSALDYLISDAIETPQGVDSEYVEKLIRLPNDYICYVPPGGYEPEVRELPAYQNGFVTLGCFNNATKLNDVVLAQWADIMNELPDSRLMLKSMQYKSEERCQKIKDTMARYGIDSGRLIIEGPSPHAELLDAYNKIDISLDPWPYSGGLTTCESFLMGVPVVSLPGPTFAGRHSATHLINAGMPELVVNSWEEYKARVVGLAADLESLSAIRKHLRQVLLSSPVCNAPLFAQHFTDAMRAIWQRHCRDESPAALTFDQQGRATFEDEDRPVDIIYAKQNDTLEGSFTWSLPSKIVILDNGGSLVRQRALAELRQLGTFGIVAFDPASQVENPAQYEGSDDIQVFSHAALGNGKPATLYACLDPTLSSTLEPLSSGQQRGESPEATKVIAKLPINTIALDSIEGLDSLDWLILDSLSDAATILEHGQRALRDALVIQVCIAFQPTHHRQPNLAEVQHWMARNGFRFYRFNNERYRSYLPESVPGEKRQATELISADAIFLPSHERIASLGNDQTTKLAFLLHTIYGIKDMAYSLLEQLDGKKSERYLMVEQLLEEKGRSIPQEVPPGEHKRAKGNVQGDEVITFSLPQAPHMSSAERHLFKKSLKKAQRYFEFGSGGSTVWAVKEGLVVQGVESDVNWVKALHQMLGANCQVQAVDIGPTGDWGFPMSADFSEQFPAYSEAIYQYHHPFDLILVDGRFRVACTMTAILHILKTAGHNSDARIFIHDFWNRPHYHVVLQFLEVVEKVDTAGLFKLSRDVNKERVLSVWEEYSKKPQ